ncbi:VTT domain-containing protein [Methylophaga sp.]|uniref:VTT domain-containing protein n=1 Tax=Methylophaga sp. TaxID=2024840 RepID=UPI003F6A41DE
MSNTTILQPGVNCWQKVKSDKVALLIDGENYFGAFHSAIQKARQSVYILSWDIDSRMRLIRKEDKPSDLPEELGAFISEVLKQNSELNVYILNWDWAMVYTLEREWLPMYKPTLKSQPRLHFKLDGECPLGASQHQKVVVIDDEIAFSGGFDLGKHRWDTSSHNPDDDRRIDPDKQPYPPFHDVQMLVSGKTAKVLAELARERWFRATGEQLTPADKKNDSAWPEQVDAWFENVDVGIARTFPEYENHPEVREVEQLFTDSIRAADKLIYIENQYFTSWKVADLLAESLQQRTGPDIVLVLPLMTGGWLEQMTMDVLRHRVACRLQEADDHNRLRICYPHNEAFGSSYISVHAKIMVIDDTFLRVGSANLSNRSMGLDSECDLAIEATNDGERDRVSRFRERLLSEHFDLSEEALRKNLSQEGSLIKMIDARQEGKRTLKPLDCGVPEMAEQMLPRSAIVDPERPLQPEQMTQMFIPIEQPGSARKQWWKIVVVLLAVIALTVVWRFTPLSEWLNPETLKNAAESIKAHPLTPLLVLVAFSLAGLLAFPVTLLIVTTALTFGPVWGTFYSVIGALLSALMAYGVGHHLGRKTVQKLAGSSINRLSRRLAHHGILAIITVRIIPVAPFVVINLVAGASHIKARDFVLGTLLGMLPGILGLTVFADSLLKTVQEPKPGQIAVFVIIIAVIIAVMLVLKRVLNQKQEEEEV